MAQNLSSLISSINYVGAQGDKGGLNYTFDATSQSNDPANGNIRFNNATFGSVTTVYIDGLTADGANIESFVDTWGDSTSTVKGFLVIKSNTNTSDTYSIFEVTGVTTQAGWTDIAVQNPVGAAPSNNEKIVVDFVRAGDKGDTGNTGPQGGKGGLNYIFDGVSTLMADPGGGIFRFNNSSLGSVTAIAIDATTTEGTDISDYIASWDDSTSTTNYGQIIVKSNANDDATYVIFNVTGTVTDNTGWLQISVGSGVGSIPTNGEICSIEFNRTGDKGDTGNTGPQGDKGGLNYTFNGSTTIADPGAGLFRYNTTSVGSVTAIAIDATTTEGTDVSDFIASWDDSTSTTNYGQIIIKSNANYDATYNIFNITGTVTDNTGWLQLTVSGGTGSAIPNSGENCTIEFSRTGDKGDTGNTGPQGDKGGLYYLFDGTSQANNPANGDVRFNNATFGSVTTVYVDGLTADSANVESFVDTWGDSTSTVKGFLVIKSNTNADDTYCIFEVTGVTAQAGWTDIAVQNPVGAAPTDNEGIVVDFIRTGDKGDTGNTGPTGETGPTSPRGFTVIEPTLNLIVPIFHTLGVTTITNVSSYIGGNTSPSA